MRADFFVLGLVALVGCGVEVDVAPAAAPPALACEIVADEVIEVTPSYDRRIAVSGDGVVFVVWGDEGFRAARRSPDGVWDRIDGAAAGAPLARLALVGTPQGAAALLFGAHEPTTLWRFLDGGWHRALEMMSEQASNQSHANFAAAADGSLHFALNVEREDDRHLELLALAASSDVPLSLGEIEDGRDPMLAVDARGARHVVYESDGDLAYLSPHGTRHTIPQERHAWPSLAAGPDALLVFSAGDTSFVNGQDVALPPQLLASRDGEEWERFSALERIAEPCPDLGTWNHERIGEVCQHHVYGDEGHVLLGGHRGLLLLRELRARGTKVWGCSDEGEHMCSWQRGDDYTETRRLLIGRASRGGTTLGPLPLELVGFGSHQASFDAAQDASGGVHLLLGEPNDDETLLRYVQLTCHDEAQ
jgi:hypothetical protein